MKKRKFQRVSAVMLTLVFAVGICAVTAFATTDGSSTNSEVHTVQQAQASSDSGTSSVDGGTGGDVGPSPDSSSSGSGSSSSESSAGSETSSTTGSSSGTGSGETVSSGGEASSSSTPESSKTPSSSKEASSKPTRSVDTRQEEIDQRASEAEAAVSDPDALSSQDWSDLLSSGSQSSEAAAGALSSDASSAPGDADGQGGGISWLLVAGIVLIALGVAGIGFFVYAQFFANRRKGGPLFDGPMDISSHSPDTPQKPGEPMEFEDISSHSDVEPATGSHAPEGVRPAGSVHSAGKPAGKALERPRPSAGKPKAPAGKPRPQAEKPEPSAGKPEPNDRDATAPIPSVPDQGTETRPKSQATPVQNSDFDWEKFFNDDDQ